MLEVCVLPQSYELAMVGNSHSIHGSDLHNPQTSLSQGIHNKPSARLVSLLSRCALDFVLHSLATVGEPLFCAALVCSGEC